MRQRQQKNRNQDAVIKARKEQLATMPVNQFLNARDKEGKIQYPHAEKMRKYYLANLDPAQNAIRLANSLLHELRWHQDRERMYLAAFNSKNKIIEVDKFGKVLSREECYTSSIAEGYTCYVVLSKLREHLVQGLLPLVEGIEFTLEQYHDYLVKMDKKVTSLGFELFPEKLEILDPK